MRRMDLTSIKTNHAKEVFGDLRQNTPDIMHGYMVKQLQFHATNCCNSQLVHQWDIERYMYEDDSSPNSLCGANMYTFLFADVFLNCLLFDGVCLLCTYFCIKKVKLC